MSSRPVTKLWASTGRAIWMSGRVNGGVIRQATKLWASCYGSNCCKSYSASCLVRESLSTPMGESLEEFIIMLSRPVTQLWASTGRLIRHVAKLWASRWGSYSASDKTAGELLGESLLESYSASKLLGGKVARQVTRLVAGRVSSYV
jgi:hypothetical protein